MSIPLRRLPPTPRALVVGLVVFGVACHRHKPVAATPAPAPAPAKARPAAPTPASVSSAITSTSTLARAMHDRYASTIPHTITFVQKTTVVLSSGGQVVQTWYTAGDPPGRWRVETDVGSRSGILYLGDSTFQFVSGKLARTDTGRDEILTLAFDLFASPATRTEALLRRIGINPTLFHERTWRESPVYVIGAARGDSTSKQVWIDRQRLLPVRLLGNTRQGRTDIRFNSWVRSGDSWIASELEQYVNGRRRLLEELSQIHTNPELPDGLFDPRRWATVPHWTP